MRKSVSVVLGLLLFPLSASAQNYPSRPITMVVPFPAGGPSDVVARIIAEHMGKTLRQPVVVENIGGAGGTLGSARVAAAQPDGYTLLAGSMGSHVSAPALTPNMKYDSARDFEAIGQTVDAPAVIVARKDFPAKDLSEFIAYVRANGDRVKQAHGGIGSSSHMACLLFAAQAQIKPTLVAYRGVNLAINDLLGGHVDFYCEQAVSVAQQVASGTLKAYAITGGERDANRVEGFDAGEARLAGGERLRGDELIVATGAATALAALAPELTMLAPIKGHILTAPRVEVAGPVVRYAGGYVCPGAAGAVIGATMEAGRADSVVDPAAAAALLATAAEAIPRLSGARTIARAGVRAATPDGLPLVGPSVTQHVWIAAGARRNGWLLAPLIAEALVAALAGERAPEAFSPARFG